jgi:hypothetical protein
VQGSLPAEGPVDEAPPDFELGHLSAADLAASSEEGALFVEELNELENRISGNSKLRLDQQSPEAGHLKVIYRVVNHSKCHCWRQICYFLLSCER